jgi:hypothetical protein
MAFMQKEAQRRYRSSFQRTAATLKGEAVSEMLVQEERTQIK